jgi:hypothetical protein
MRYLTGLIRGRDANTIVMLAEPEPPPQGAAQAAVDEAALREALAAPPPSALRHCKACDVQWHDGTACWCCGQPVTGN